MNLVDLIVIVVLAEAFLHYFHWRLILGGKDLPRLAAYAFGVLGLMLPYTRWLWVQDMVLTLEAIKVLWIVIISGGLSVLGCYGADAIVDLVWGKREAEAREQMLLEQRHGKGKSA